MGYMGFGMRKEKNTINPINGKLIFIFTADFIASLAS